MNPIDNYNHVSGRSIFLDDLPLFPHTFHALPFCAPLAHGRIRRIDMSKALNIPGVVQIFSHADIPGENQIGGAIQDEPLLAEKEVSYQGQPILLVVAKDPFTARQARALIEADIEPLPVVTDTDEAFEKGQFLFPPRTFSIGDTESAWPTCAHRFEGVAETGAQEHLYLETQGAYAVPQEGGKMKIFSATQGPATVQHTAARVLGIPMHQIEVEVNRIGGGFGGKEDQATPWACLAALAAWKLGLPVKLVLDRHDDMRMTGKRHPYRSRFKIGLSKDLRILAYEVVFLQNGGAATDLSPAIMERTLFHTTGAYFIPNVRARAYSCRTNLPPNTAFRGFGGPQAMFVIESAIAHAALELGIPAWRIQEKNLLRNGDEFPYGQRASGSHTRNCWRKLKSSYKLRECEAAVRAFNRSNDTLKKGLALMPICFGISFTKTSMNQAGALVHIYHDGSIGLSTGAVEMGQGIYTKLLQVVAREFSVNPSRVRMEHTNTTRVANTSPTAASSGADLNGKAVQHACSQLRERLLDLASTMLSLPKTELALQGEGVWHKNTPTALGWEDLIAKAFASRINLSAQGYYATPGIWFDRTKEKGMPFAYYVSGAALLMATVDCLRGEYHIDEVDIIHDFGDSINPIVDQGQLEGGVVQGLGWMTCEEVRYDPQGRLQADTLSTYKVPDIYATPGKILFQPLVRKGPKAAILRSRAIGEPPFMYGIAGYFAIQNAIRAFNPGYLPDFVAPLTPERVLMALYERDNPVTP